MWQNCWSLDKQEKYWQKGDVSCYWPCWALGCVPHTSYTNQDSCYRLRTAACLTLWLQRSCSVTYAMQPCKGLSLSPASQSPGHSEPQGLALCPCQPLTWQGMGEHFSPGRSDQNFSHLHLQHNRAKRLLCYSSDIIVLPVGMTPIWVLARFQVVQLQNVFPVGCFQHNFRYKR